MTHKEKLLNLVGLDYFDSDFILGTITVLDKSTDLISFQSTTKDFDTLEQIIGNKALQVIHSKDSDVCDLCELLLKKRYIHVLYHDKNGTKEIICDH